jgi:hypothetical protein
MIRVRPILTTPKKSNLPNGELNSDLDDSTTTQLCEKPRIDSARNTVRSRLFRGASATALTPIVTAVIQLAAMPCFLHFWGAAKYGDWLILSAIPSYLSLRDLGFGELRNGTAKS